MVGGINGSDEVGKYLAAIESPIGEKYCGYCPVCGGYPPVAPLYGACIP